jgi:hypothetical protein
VLTLTTVLLSRWSSTPVTATHGVETDPVKCLAILLMSETSVGEREERVAVAWTVFNRVNSPSFPNTICDVTQQPGQYAHNQAPTTEISNLAATLVDNPGVDPTGGATHFFSPLSMPKEGDSTDGFDVNGGLHEVPGIDRKVYFPSWTTTMDWVGNLPNVRQAYYMFYQPAGDINNDNSLDARDYNLLLDCYSDSLPARSCNGEKKQDADLNDDGNVNQRDYNIMLRAFCNLPRNSVACQ